MHNNNSCTKNIAIISDGNENKKKNYYNKKKN